jgi:hypothetical protein
VSRRGSAGDSARPARVARTPEQREAAIRSQLGFLVRSCAAFDQGATDESRRIANAVWMLSSELSARSLKGMLFPNTSNLHLGNRPGVLLLSPAGLVMMRMVAGAPGSGFVARLDQAVGHDVVSERFQDWWNWPAFDGGGRRFSRMEVVREMRHTDGGAHIDPSLDADYEALLRYTAGMTFMNGSSQQVEIPPSNYADATVRQIAHELLRAVQRDWRTEALMPASGYDPVQPGPGQQPEPSEA